MAKVGSKVRKTHYWLGATLIPSLTVTYTFGGGVSIGRNGMDTGRRGGYIRAKSPSGYEDR